MPASCPALLHFTEMFIPGSDIAPDGQVHAENAREMNDSTPTPATLTCHCGFTSDIDGLDQHLTEPFTPADRIGLDGKKHVAQRALQIDRPQ